MYTKVYETNVREKLENVQKQGIEKYFCEHIEKKNGKKNNLRQRSVIKVVILE